MKHLIQKLRIPFQNHYKKLEEISIENNPENDELEELGEDELVLIININTKDLNNNIQILSSYSKEDARALAYIMFCMENKIFSDQIIADLEEDEDLETFKDVTLNILDEFDKKLGAVDYRPAISPLEVIK